MEQRQKENLILFNIIYTLLTLFIFSIFIIKAAMSEGVIPGILLAWPKEI
ncbi:unnamed protein product, partial [marine sediment metagenome]